jgi:hypothetical protein
MSRGRLITWVAVLALALQYSGTLRADILTPASFVRSDLFLVVLNPLNGASQVVDLGPLDAALHGGRHWRIDPAYARILAPSPLDYLVVAGDMSQQSQRGFGGLLLYTTAAPAAVPLMTPDRWSSNAIRNSLSLVDQYLVAVIDEFAVVSGWPTFRSRAVKLTNWGPVNARATAPGRQYALSGFDAAGRVGELLPFYEIASGPTPSGLATDGAVRRLGVFRLRGTELTYTPDP